MSMDGDHGRQTAAGRFLDFPTGPGKEAARSSQEAARTQPGATGPGRSQEQPAQDAHVAETPLAPMNYEHGR